MGPGLNKHTSIWSRLYPGFVLLTLSAAMAFSLIDRFALSLLFEPIKADLQLSDTQLGLLHGVAFGLFYATLGIPIAWLVDRWSRKWVIFLGIGCWSAMTALCGFSRNFSQLLGARIGVGVGEAALAPGGYSLIADVVPKNKFATAISIFQMGSLFGAGLALLLGGQILGFVETIDLSGMPLLGSLAPWQLTFIVLALPGIPFLLVLLLFREPLRTGVVSDEPAVGLLEELRKKYQVYTCLFLGNACLVAVSYGNVTWIPSILARQYGWSIPDIGVRLGLLTLIVAPLGILAGGLLADARTRRGSTSPSSGLLMLSGVTTLILVVVGLFAQSAWALFAMVGLIQFSTGLVVGVGPAASVNLASDGARGRISAVYVFVTNLIGLGLGPTLVGFLSDTVFAGEILKSLQAFWLMMSISAVLLLAYLLRIGARTALHRF